MFLCITLFGRLHFTHLIAVWGKGLISLCEIQGCQTTPSFERKGHFIASCCAFIF